jgi:hypothetical protein
MLAYSIFQPFVPSVLLPVFYKIIELSLGRKFNALMFGYQDIALFTKNTQMGDIRATIVP